MKRKIFITVLAVAMTIGPGFGFAQMMGPGQHMYGGSSGSGPEMMEGTGQQSAPPAQPQNTPYQMYPGMMGYGGYGMGPGMMGYGGYGMGPGMMGYGYGMGPGMMGYGMMPGMMGGYGYGMGHGMMGYGMGTGKWGGCGGWYPGTSGEYAEKYNKALDETQELRRKLNALQFDYNEALRDPEVSIEKQKEMAGELFELREQIRQKMHQ